MCRKTIARYGIRGHSVRVFVECDNRKVMAQWRELGLIKTRSWPNTRLGRRDAKSWACAQSAPRDDADRTNIVVGDLWSRYRLTEFHALRPKTIANYLQCWKIWESFAGSSVDVERVTVELIGKFQLWLCARKYAVSRQREICYLIKSVFRWGVLCELVRKDRLSFYRFKSFDRAVSREIPEYAPNDYRRLVRQVDPQLVTQWRAWVLFVILGELGVRVNAALHLKWDDVDFTAAKSGTVIWRAAHDKRRRERHQLLTPAARDALYVALGWSPPASEYSPWVFPASRRVNAIPGHESRPYSIQGFWWMLRKAEERACITHVRYGAAHRFRRMAAGNALEITGNVADAMWWIGDTDLRYANKYLRPRDSRMHLIAEKTSYVTGNMAKGARSVRANRNGSVTAANRDVAK